MDVGRGAQHRGYLRREQGDGRGKRHQQVGGQPEPLVEHLLRARRVAAAQALAGCGGGTHAQCPAQRQVQQLQRKDDGDGGQAERPQAVADDEALQHHHHHLRQHAGERDGGVAGEQRLDGSGAQLAFGGFGFDEQLVHYRRPP